MPYKAFKTDGKYNKHDVFYHIYTNTTLDIDLWRGSQPNNIAKPEDNGEICVKSYFGKKFFKKNTLNNYH